MAADAFPEQQAETLSRMDAARNYNAWLLERARPHLGPRVLDAGAGTGTFTERLAGLAREVVAVEPDPALLPALHARLGASPGVRIVEALLDELPEVGLEPVDAVVCFNVLEHVEDDVGALRALREVLLPGGKLLLLVPAHERLYGEIDRAVAHVRRYARPALGRTLVEAGYAVDTLRYVNPVGAAGWLVSSRLLRQHDVPKGGLALYDRFVPILRLVDALRLPFGLSLWAVATVPEV